jgi:transposase
VPAAGTPAGKPQEPRRGRAGGRPAAAPKVPDSALERIEQALLEGALAHGFTTDVWTLERIALVIQGLTGVGLSNPSVWRLLRGRLGWSVQRPARQAKERDEEAIQHWVQHEWPWIKTDSLIGVLEQLKDFYAGQRVVLLWDGLSAHWSRMRNRVSAIVSRCTSSQGGWAPY